MAFADLTDVEDLLDFELDEQAQRACVAKLQQASSMARHYARPLGERWPESRCPAIVKTIVINVVERYMRNPDNYTQSRAGDETLAWEGSDGKGSFHFTDEEKEILADVGRASSGLYSVQTYQHNATQNPGDAWIPTSSGSFFPMFAGQDAWLWNTTP